MNKKIILVIIIFFSLFIGVSGVNCIIIDAESMFSILINILGIAFATYTFIFAPLSKLYKKDSHIKNSVYKVLIAIEKNLKLIFVFLIIILTSDFLIFYDFPLIKNPHQIDFGLFSINSVKIVLFNSLIAFSAIFSITLFYDIMKATFIVLKGAFDFDVEL